MHAMFFGIKRVHLRVLHVTRVLLRGKELTPARFDMMRIIELHREGVAQSTIQYLLGVSAPTVSRMLKSLEQLGFVARSRMTDDGRRQLVELTRLGLQRIREALSSLVASGVADRMAARALALDPEVARPQLDALQRFLTCIRRNLGDPTPYPHPWRSGNLAPYTVNTILNGQIAYGATLM